MSEQSEHLSEDGMARDQVMEAARRILRYVSEPDEMDEINLWLAELEAYPSFVLRIQEVK